MAYPMLRDRDAIVTREGLIFRVLGYSHGHSTFFCDVEYAPAEVFRSEDPRAFRQNLQHVFFKFFGDEGWKTLQRDFPRYMVKHEMLGRKVTGVKDRDISEVRLPAERLASLWQSKPGDVLVNALHEMLETVTAHSGLSATDFGVFGSMLHVFHNPGFSDMDLTVYGKRSIATLLETLADFYAQESSPLSNEFETEHSLKGKRWRFLNLTPQEYLQHQKRKLIYAVFHDAESHRAIKTEFEPIRKWEEIVNDYDCRTRVLRRGWVKMLARVRGDDESAFMPSTYEIEPIEVLEGSRIASEATRIVSFVEEFRMQCSRDEVVHVAGNLEQVVTPQNSHYQITLTCCPRYYEQVLKLKS